MVKITFDKDLELNLGQLNWIRDSCKILSHLKEYEGKSVEVESICVLQRDGIVYLIEGKGFDKLGVQLTQKQTAGLHYSKNIDNCVV